MKPITQLKNLKGTYVLLRADFNVPIKNNRIIDPFRIMSAFPTLSYLLGKGAKVIIVTHAGDDGMQSLKPIATYLGKKYPVVFSPEVLGGQTNTLREKMQPGTILLLENIRREKGEKENGGDGSWSG